MIVGLSGWQFASAVTCQSPQINEGTPPSQHFQGFGSDCHSVGCSFISKVVLEALNIDILRQTERYSELMFVMLLRPNFKLTNRLLTRKHTLFQYSANNVLQ
jgi:hypothetical protein